MLDSDGILHRREIPRALVCRRRCDRHRVRLDVRGPRYAGDGRRGRRDRLLEFCDARSSRRSSTTCATWGSCSGSGRGTSGSTKHDGGTITHARRAASGSRPTRSCTPPAGRARPTRLGLGNVGIEADSRGRISVDEHYRTSVEHIYAVGDVIGFPSLASTSIEQGRLAAAHACGLDVRPIAARCRSASTRSPRSASSAAPRSS